MEKTLLVGDFLFVNKFVYGAKVPFTDINFPKVHDVRQGDIIVFKYPRDPDIDYVKRVVGLPGDLVEVRADQLIINGQPVQARDDQTVMQVARENGFFIPYFCWHPALHSVGACRQCAVKQFKDEKDSRGKLVMACMTRAADGTRISIADVRVFDKEGREALVAGQGQGLHRAAADVAGD